MESSSSIKSISAKQEPVGPRGRRLLGSLLEVRNDRIKFVTEAARTYGDFVCFKMGPKRLYLLSHPSYAKHVLCDRPENYGKGLGLNDARILLGQGLLTSQGALWKRQRRFMQPAFHELSMEAYQGAMLKAAMGVAERWRDYARTGQPLDVAQDMARLTLTVLGETILQAERGEVAREISEDLSLLADWAMRRMAAFSKLPIWFPSPNNLRARRALRRLEGVTDSLIRQHNQSASGESEPLLARLLSYSEAEKHLVRDEVMTLLLAGHETTAATLTWVWHLLSQHPEIANRLYQELEEVLGGRCPTLADLPQLNYTRMVLDETLRLYPPVWMLPRRAIADDQINGHAIPSGADVLLCLFTLHRHPDFWDNPEQFDPERFSAGQAAGRAPFAYLPFGTGPRTCLGKRFGLTEIMLVLAVLASRFRMEAIPNHRVEIKASLSLYPRNGLAMRLFERCVPTELAAMA
jgi:enediyne biosynthesis protein E7